MEAHASLAGEGIFRRMLDYDLAGAKRYNRPTTLVRVTPVGSHPEYIIWLQEAARKTDRFFAYQGDNVIVMMRETNSPGALAMTRRTHESCTEEVDLRFALVTFPDDGKSAGELLETLDRRYQKALQSSYGTIVNQG